MRQLSRLVLVVSALCAGQGLASAATLTETDPFAIDTTTGPGAPSSESLSFAQFDSSLGTLTGISIQLTGSANSVLAFANNSTSAIPFTNGTSSTDFSLMGTGFSTDSSPVLTESVASGSMNGSAASPAPVFTYFSGTSSAVTLFGTVSGANLAAYRGTGTATVTAGFGSATSSASFTSPGGSLFAGVGGGGQASGDVTVTYTYAPVPLPGAVWLLVSGIVGLSGLARRKLSPSAA